LPFLSLRPFRHFFFLAGGVVVGAPVEDVAVVGAGLCCWTGAKLAVIVRLRSAL
jgi:hypothetical protein